MAWYNLGCVAAAAKRPDEAFQYLHQAVVLGYSDPDHLQQDEDLKPIRSDPRFAALVGEARKQLNARQKGSS